MRLGLTYDLQTDPADERQAEFDPPATIGALRLALEARADEVRLLGGPEALLRSPQRLEGLDLVFNIAEGRSGRNREAWAPNLLELLGVPYAGSDALALMLGLDKVMSKRLAAAAGVATPAWCSIAHPDALPKRLPLRFPLIVKPRHQGSGRGIGPGAVVGSSAALSARVRWLFARCPEPILIEEFVPYGELTVLVIGNHPAVAHPPAQRPIDSASRLSCHVVTPAPETWDCPVVLDDALDQAARAMALTMFHAVTCRDVARVDLRVNEAGQLSFLEINPLPSYDPEGTFGLIAEQLGLSYAAMVGQVLDAAVTRFGLACEPAERTR